MALTDGADDCRLDNPLTRWITRWRLALLWLPILFLLLGFNGKWRIGTDSSQYRGLALNLAHGNGYTFGEWAPKQIYPGYPTILAGIERVFGPAKLEHGPADSERLIGPSAATTASVIFNILCGLAVLWLTDALVRLRFPIWVATLVTVGLGCSRNFIEQSHSLMTDMPFLAAVLLTLWAWESLESAGPGQRRSAWAVTAIIGMLSAALLRPMFWVFLVAWLIVCLRGLIRGNRAFYAGCLLSLLIIGGGTALLRPSGYEYEARDVVLPQLQAKGWSGLYDCLHDQLPYAMFGEQLRPISMVGSSLVLLSSLLLIRKHLLWTLAVFGTLCVTILLSDEPRYWLMILPILMLSWLIMTCWIAKRFGPIAAQGILLASIAIVGLNNLAACIAFFYEQHRADFMTHYKKGEYQTTIAMAEKIHELVRPDQKVLGPSGSILSIFSGVHVYTKREVMPRDEGVDPKAPAAFAKVRFDYVIFPAELYREKEPLVSRLIDKHIILQRQAIATVKPANSRGADHTPLILATARFSVPSTDWRKLPKGWRPPTTKPVKHVHPTTRPRKKKPTTRPTTRAATRPRPVTRPTTQAATTSSS